MPEKIHRPRKYPYHKPNASGTLLEVNSLSFTTTTTTTTCRRYGDKLRPKLLRLWPEIPSIRHISRQHAELNLTSKPDALVCPSHNSLDRGIAHPRPPVITQTSHACYGCHSLFRPATRPIACLAQGCVNLACGEVHTRQ